MFRSVEEEVEYIITGEPILVHGENCCNVIMWRYNTYHDHRNEHRGLI